MFLGSVELKRRIQEEGLVKDYINLDDQLQPNGFDMTLQRVERYLDEGIVYTNSKKKLPAMGEVTLQNNMWFIQQGVYLGYLNEEVKIPKGLCAIHTQRSTLARCGCFTPVGFWDSGYNGRGTVVLNVANKHGIVIEKNTKVVQMFFIPVFGDSFMYNGQYQNENKEWPYGPMPLFTVGGIECK
jgi:dUTP pyrophosphatase